MSYKIKVITHQPVAKKSVKKITVKKAVKGAKTKSKSVKPLKPTYTIEVYDDANKLIESKDAATTLIRSRIINDMREFYNTDDVKYIDVDGKARHKKAVRKIAVPIIDFSTEDELTAFFAENPDILYNRIIESIEEGISFNKKMIKLFELGQTGVYLTSPRSAWVEGLIKSINHFEQTNHFENCQKCTKLIGMLDIS